MLASLVQSTQVGALVRTPVAFDTHLYKSSLLVTLCQKDQRSKILDPIFGTLMITFFILHRLQSQCQFQVSFQRKFRRADAVCGWDVFGMGVIVSSQRGHTFS